LTFVALDENDKPVEIEQIIPETEEEKRRYEEGKKRRETRIKIISKDSHPQTPCIARIKE
jgi:acyl-CoA hydrolase